MAKGKIVKAVKFLKSCLIESGLNISKVVLFGSQAKNTANQDSDVDVVIISNDFKGKDIFERARLTKDAEIKAIKRFIVPFDIITLTGKEWRSGSSLIRGFAEEGGVIY